MFESRKVAIEKRKEEKRTASAGLKERIEAVTIELKVSTGDTGKLFGSVTNANIAEELKKSGIILERKKIELPEHTIKTVGEFTAKIKHYGNESADLKIIIKSDKKIAEAVKAEKPSAKEVKKAGPAPKEEAEETVPQEEAKEADSQEEVKENEVSESVDEA